MLAGHIDGAKTSFSSISEAVGEFNAGKITREKLEEFECKTCPTCGSCSGMYTANSMNCLTEVLGMGLKGNGTIPAVYSARIKLAKHAGAGTLVPITGFSNSIASAALEFKTEGLILGTATKMFTIAGPVLVFGISASVAYGLLLCLFGAG